ncbi:hypothetical protein BD410DRAFT_842200 [Rickenella mellea]|uniref:Uncharacterized protein n=1 Tax=Rickenella mellea TaxID=50990 RepID=A0A4Y7PXM8_9AGAM|nr:hypothetical protein BD410DRAFT_842200 [Rickenella mellea]
MAVLSWLIRDFCVSPPPPEMPTAIYGLLPPTLNRIPIMATLNPKSFNRYAAYRFSLALHCVVEVGVGGSESIRGHIVANGESGCPWLFRRSRGSSWRFQTQQREKEREHAEKVGRLLALGRQLANIEESVTTKICPSSVKITTTPPPTQRLPSRQTHRRTLHHSAQGTPTGSVVPPPQLESFKLSHRRTLRAMRSQQDTTTSSSSISRPETETEDDGDQDADGDIEMSQDRDTNENIPPPLPHPHPHVRRAVGVVSDLPPPNGGAGGPSDSLEVDLDAHYNQYDE